MMGNAASNYIFPATVAKETNNYGVYFCDLPGCIATGSTLDEALRAAKEGLALHLWGMEQDGDSIPTPTPFEKIRVKEGETLCLLDINFIEYTSPVGQDELAEERHIDCSQVLQSALRERLGAAATK